MSSQIVEASPSKFFFMKMLTRDIELKAAILDLLDNCIDGAIRVLGPDHIEPSENKYERFHAELSFDGDSITLKDNCGGITKEIAQQYAFKFGREDYSRDANIPTVGMYGIGMKRAIFKIGTTCSIETRTSSDHFRVDIPLDWENSEYDWSFPLTDLTQEEGECSEEGTVITISGLHDSIRREIFGNNSSFIEDLKEEIATHYAYLIDQGFDINVGGTQIEPVQVYFALNNNIQPYVYEATIDDVTISLIIGFREHMISEDEEEEEKEHQKKSQDAGWTIVCNDRVVVYRNKERVTGWGETPVPQYHTQFINISGVVEFKSLNASALPLTTTKRGIDANSELYAYVKDFMKEGLKIFTGHTNTWKKKREEEKELYSQATNLTARQAIRAILDNHSSNVSSPTNRFNKESTVDQIRFKPELPKPHEDNKTKTIRFTKQLDEIAIVSQHLFEDSEVDPSSVGAECFDQILSEIKK
ncbi:MAG: ATP-binding protein [Oleiphilaceae bacterium]|nr:ATP-binding protein [Oleiphilaceae bacterium]